MQYISLVCCFVTNIYVFKFSLIVGTYYVLVQVAIFYEDGRPVEASGAGRKILDKVKKTYDSELRGKDFAYDGEKTLFTMGSLAQNKLEFTVVLEDVTSSRLKCVNIGF